MACRLYLVDVFAVFGQYGDLSSGCFLLKRSSLSFICCSWSEDSKVEIRRSVGISGVI